MTATEVKALLERELDALIAEKVMGWRRYKKAYDGFPGLVFFLSPNSFHDGGYIESQIKGGLLRETASGGDESNAPNYSTDSNASALVLEQIESLDLVESCIDFLFDITDGKNKLGWWSLITATPRQRCEAALLAWEESKP